MGWFMEHTMRTHPWIAAVVALVVVAACGGEAHRVSLGGVARTDGAIAGASVEVACANGARAHALTGADGTWQTTVASGGEPCAARVRDGSLAEGEVYHGLVAHASEAPLDLTPLTDLLVAATTGQDPRAWFDAVDAADWSGVRDATRRTAALEKVRVGLGLPVPLTDEPADWLTDEALLNALGSTLANLGLSLDSLRAQFAAGASPDGLFRRALANAVSAPTGMPDNNVIGDIEPSLNDLWTASSYSNMRCDLCRRNCTVSDDRYSCLSLCELVC